MVGSSGPDKGSSFWLSKGIGILSNNLSVLLPSHLDTRWINNLLASDKNCYCCRRILPSARYRPRAFPSEDKYFSIGRFVTVKLVQVMDYECERLEEIGRLALGFGHLSKKMCINVETFQRSGDFAFLSIVMDNRDLYEKAGTRYWRSRLLLQQDITEPSEDVIVARRKCIGGMMGKKSFKKKVPASCTYGLTNAINHSKGRRQSLFVA